MVDNVLDNDTIHDFLTISTTFHQTNTNSGITSYSLVIQALMSSVRGSGLIIQAIE